MKKTSRLTRKIRLEYKINIVSLISLLISFSAFIISYKVAFGGADIAGFENKISPFATFYFAFLHIQDNRFSPAYNIYRTDFF